MATPGVGPLGRITKELSSVRIYDILIAGQWVGEMCAEDFKDALAKARNRWGIQATVIYNRFSTEPKDKDEQRLERQ